MKGVGEERTQICVSLYRAGNPPSRGVHDRRWHAGQWDRTDCQYCIRERPWRLISKESITQAGSFCNQPGSGVAAQYRYLMGVQRWFQVPSQTAEGRESSTCVTTFWKTGMNVGRVSKSAQRAMGGPADWLGFETGREIPVFPDSPDPTAGPRIPHVRQRKHGQQPKRSEQCSR